MSFLRTKSIMTLTVEFYNDTLNLLHDFLFTILLNSEYLNIGVEN